MKPRLHYHSDCTFFAGCENMLVNFFADSDLNQAYDISFSYRASDAYEQGLKGRVEKLPEHTGLKLIDFDECNHSLKKRMPMFHTCISILVYSIVKYFIILKNTIVLARYFRSQRIDILHINNGGLPGAYSCYASAFAAKLVGIKHIVFVVNNLAISYRHPSRWFDWPLDQWLKRSVEVFVTGSQFAGNRLIHTLGIEPIKYKKIANGIRTRSLQQTAQSYRASHSISEQTILIGIIAVLEPRKGHLYLLEAISQLAQQQLDFKLIIEGSGSEHTRILHLIQEHGLNDRVIMIAAETHIFDLTNALDILVLPSINNEDFPNIILEAMSLGKPIVATEIAGVPEQIEHEKTGFIVPPKDSKSLAHALAQLLTNENLRTQMGAKGKENFMIKFSSQTAVSCYLKLYQALQGHTK